jgi:hypothetical protein
MDERQAEMNETTLNKPADIGEGFERLGQEDEK